MKRELAELGALAFVILLSLSLFVAVPRPFPHAVSYKYALEAKGAIVGGGSSEPFYELTKFAYFALGGMAQPFDAGLFGLIVSYLPPLLGLISAVAIYIAVRARAGPGIGAIGAVFIACSASFLLNSLSGVYTPEIMSVALFSLSLMFFLLADVAGGPGGILLALLAGVLLGYNMTVSEAGPLLGASLVASAAVQFIYYLKEKEPVAYGVRLGALVLLALPFLAGAKLAAVIEHLSWESALASYSLILPLISIFVYTAVRDLVGDTRKYEEFFLALSLGSVGIALFDPVAAAPGMAVGAVFGVVAVKDHLSEKWLMAGFVALAVGASAYPLASGLTKISSALALSGLIGGLAALVFLLYDNAKARKHVAFGGIVLLASSLLFSGTVLAQRQYLTIGDDWGSALSWAKANLPEDAVIAAIGPTGFVDYIAGRKGCCDAEAARFLLGSGGTEALKAKGATYLMVDSGYFDELSNLASVGNLTRAGIETYFFGGYYQDQERGNYYAYFASRTGDIMRVPIDANANPTGDDVLVDSIGPIPYGKIKRVEGEDSPMGGGAKIVLPLYGERNNLFDIYFESPEGLELVHSEASGTIRIYRVL